MSDDYRETAKQRMKGYCRVCPVCDGRACVGEVPGMGGVGTGSAFKANVEALARRRFNMRTVHGVTQPDLAVNVLGMDLSIPVLAAPIGGVSFNMGGQITEEQYVDSILGGCKAQGTIGCTGDGVPEFIIGASLAGITALGGHGIPFIKPWEDEEFFEKVGRAKDAGATIMGMDIDAAGLVTLAKMGRPVTPKTPDKLAEIIAKVGMPFILKGVMTPDEARLAADAGVAAIVVSNHGGRVLDFSPGTADVLADIAQAVGDRCCVLVDGGVRTGGDVLKMLALGADAVLVGRPFSIAAVGGLQEGVEALIERLRGELTSTMVLTGTARADAVDPGILYQG